VDLPGEVNRVPFLGKKYGKFYGGGPCDSKTIELPRVCRHAEVIHNDEKHMYTLQHATDSEIGLVGHYIYQGDVLFIQVENKPPEGEGVNNV
jgi:hypothetical protein